MSFARNQPEYLPQLDGVRAVAVALVLLAHASPTTDLPFTAPLWRAVELLRTGYVGVDLFFVLSGFLITRLLLAERRATGAVDVRGFYLKRLLRIAPIYYAAVLAVGALWPATPGLRASLLAFAYNLYLPFHPHPYPLEHVWSLAVEEQFYLVWPLLVGVVPPRWMRTGTLVAAPLLALGAAAALASSLPPTLAGALIYTSLPTRAFSLLLGAYLASREAGGAPLRLRGAVSACLAGGAILLATVAGRAAQVIPPGGWYWCCALLGYGVFAFGAIAAATAPDAPSAMLRPLLSRPLRFVGRISYGLYLYHLPVLYFFGINQAALGGGGVRSTRLLAAYAAAFGLATISYLAFERPVMRSGRLLLMRLTWLPRPGYPLPQPGSSTLGTGRRAPPP